MICPHRPKRRPGSARHDPAGQSNPDANERPRVRFGLRSDPHHPARVGRGRRSALKSFRLWAASCVQGLAGLSSDRPRPDRACAQGGAVHRVEGWPLLLGVGGAGGGATSALVHRRVTCCGWNLEAPRGPQPAWILERVTCCKWTSPRAAPRLRRCAPRKPVRCGRGPDRSGGEHPLGPCGVHRHCRGRIGPQRGCGGVQTSTPWLCKVEACRGRERPPSARKRPPGGTPKE